MDRFLAVAQVVKPHGRKGEVAAEILTDFPERVKASRTMYIEDSDNQPKALALEAVRIHKGRFVLKFSGIDSIEHADTLRRKHVLIPAAERAVLSAHSYYIWQLQGCRVFQDQGHASAPLVEVGTVVDVESCSGGVDILHVALPGGRDGDEVLIPLVQSICKRIDVDAKTIVIDPPEDLLELNQ